jgi:polysaccharide deacetylase 2 family uncharacterized protein YibQ
LAAKKRRRKAARRSAIPLIAILAGAVVVALVVVNIMPEPGQEASRPEKGREASPAPGETESQARPRVQTRPPEQVQSPPAPVRTDARAEQAPVPAPRRDLRAGIPKVAIVIDDCGYDQALAERFAALQVPITFAVIPHLPGSEACAEAAFARGHEVILHQPMQPEGYPETNPGEGALLVGMGRNQVVSTLTENLGAIPHVSGVNNHMGSAATADRVLMGHALGQMVVLQERYPGLYFLDSKTSARTVAYDVAREKGLPTAMRSVFLDHEESLASVKAKLEELLVVAEEEGEAIGIGHVKGPTLAALRQTLGRLGPDEFDFVFASELAR